MARNRYPGTATAAEPMYLLDMVTLNSFVVVITGTDGVLSA
jgi:hypothetical protein